MAVVVLALPPQRGSVGPWAMTDDVIAVMMIRVRVLVTLYTY